MSYVCTKSRLETKILSSATRSKTCPEAVRTPVIRTMHQNLFGSYQRRMISVGCYMLRDFRTWRFPLEARGMAAAVSKVYMPFLAGRQDGRHIAGPDLRRIRCESPFVLDSAGLSTSQSYHKRCVKRIVQKELLKLFTVPDHIRTWRRLTHISVKWFILVLLCMTNLDPSIAITFLLSWSCSAFICR